MTEEQINKLIEQLEAAKAAVVELEQILNSGESATAKYLARIDQLEQLCRDMYLGALNYYITSELLERAWRDDFEDSMTDLGLLEEK